MNIELRDELYLSPYNKANIFLGLIEYELNSLLGASHLVDYISIHIRFGLEGCLLSISQLMRQRFPSYTVYRVDFGDMICRFLGHDGLRSGPVTRFLGDSGLRRVWRGGSEIAYSGAGADGLSVFKAGMELKLETGFRIARTAGGMEAFEGGWAHHSLPAGVCNGVLALHFWAGTQLKAGL